MSDIRGLALPPLPSLRIQRRIAAILSAYDDLIENNTQRIKALEAAAQTLYREWFVEMRFPGHESAQWVGDLPEGWETVRIDDIATVHRGRSYKSEELVNNGALPFLNLKCVDRDGGFRYDGIKRYQGPFKETQTAKAGDIIIAITDMTQERRIVARAARVPATNAEMYVFSMDLVKLAPKESVPREYLYGMLRYSSFPDEVKQYANGANVLHLLPARIEDFEFAIATEDIRRKFADFCTPLYQQSDVLKLRNGTLRETRDLLLPRLISGEVSVEGLVLPGEELTEE
jgi:type I restriction enzyme S subunit